MHEAVTNLDLAQAGVALVLLGLSFVALPLAYAEVWRFWRGEPGARWLWGAVGAAALLRWFVFPVRMATMFIGFLMTQKAIDLVPVHHYGIGSSAFYHLLFGAFPQDHHTLMVVNSVVGVLTLPLLATWAAKLLQSRPAGIFAAWLIGVAPLFVRNDNSDANNVPLLWWMFAALVLWQAWLKTRQSGPLFGAAILATLASVSRPEAVAVVGVLLLVSAWAQGELSALRSPWFVGAAALGAALMIPHLLHVFGAVGELQSRSSLPSYGWSFWTKMGRELLRHNTVLDPRLFPFGFLALVVAALWRAPRRLLAFGLAGLAVGLLALYSLDLCRANMARVHVPGALLMSVLAAWGMARLWERWSTQWQRGLLLGLAALSMIPNAQTLWAQTNEETEEQLIRAAIDALPAGDFVFVRIGWNDRDTSNDRIGFTHQHFPDYLLNQGGREGRPQQIHEFISHEAFQSPVFFFSGMRCFAEFRSPGMAAPPGDNLQPACETMRARYRLEPVVEREVENYGDVWMEYYGDAPKLTLGLYRVYPRG